jgi:hypothetical protein
MSFNPWSSSIFVLGLSRDKPIFRINLASTSIGKCQVRYQSQSIQRTFYQVIYTQTSRLVNKLFSIAGSHAGNPLPSIPQKPTLKPVLTISYKTDCKDNRQELIHKACFGRFLVKAGSYRKRWMVSVLSGPVEISEIGTSNFRSRNSI